MKHRWFFLILLQSIIYGFGDPISKLMYREITVSACLSLRFTLAAAVLLCFYRKPLWSDLRKTPILHWLPAAALSRKSPLTLFLAHPEVLWYGYSWRKIAIIPAGKGSIL